MSKEKKDKKKNPSKDTMKYSTNDLGQEFIMKRKMVAAIFALFVVLGVLAVFIALYIDAKNEIQQTYYIQYHKCLENTIADIDSYNNAEADLDFKYRRVVADMNSVNSFIFLMNVSEEEKKTINEFYTAFLKYPEQMSEKMDEAKTALEDINANLDKGYDEADELIASIDLKGY